MFLRSLRITSRSAVLTLAAALLACVSLSATAATTASRGDIVAVTVHGSVTATMAGMTVPLSGGAILQLPATVRTGADGAVELRQGTSTFAAAGNTELEIPQSAAEDGLIERIIQIRGNAFYNIGKRTGTRLRVEAPYLVAVIKGTQFNVAAQEDSTTIALFEGHLEVRASDDSDVVDLDAGEIAIRRRNDVSISVLRLNAARDGARRSPELAARQQGDSQPSNTAAVTTDSVTARNADTTARPRVDTPTVTDAAMPIDNLVTPSERGRIVVDVGTTATIDVGAGSVAAAGDIGVDVGSVSADVGASAAVDVSAGTVDAGIGAAVTAGDVAAVDTSVAAAVDIPSGAVDVAAGATVAAGDVAAVDVGAAAAVDVPAGTVDVGLDTSVASTDVGAAVGVDTGAGNVSADVGVGPVDVGLDVGTGGVSLDLGLGAEDDSASSGGLLGGLLGRKRRD
jgi:hypothetical protein